ncbi:hypothetical protein AGMMS50233_10170 [Endomicrobiia bacterium]|nr:hypothetical protein AGMMS50233_10170 [Endomicrobiia bacterium]
MNIKKYLRNVKKQQKKGSANAHYNLGVMYYEGKGVEQNYKEATNWLKKAVKQGHSGAKIALTEINESEYYRFL